MNSIRLFAQNTDIFGGGDEDFPGNTPDESPVPQPDIDNPSTPSETPPEQEPPNEPSHTPPETPPQPANAR